MKLLRAFGVNRYDTWSEVSWYSKFGFQLDTFLEQNDKDAQKIRKAIEWLRGLAKKDMNKHFVDAVKHFLKWNDETDVNTNLAEAMAALHGNGKQLADRERYAHAVQELFSQADVAKTNGQRWVVKYDDQTPMFYDALSSIQEMWHMKLVYKGLAQNGHGVVVHGVVQKELHDKHLMAKQEMFDTYYAYGEVMDDELEDLRERLVMKLLRMERERK